MSDAVLTVHDLVVEYQRGRLFGRVAPVRVVKGVDIDVAAGESVALVGESGCGKSTFARAVLGLTPHAGGEIRLAGELARARRTPAQRRLVQLVFQDPYSSLNPRMTVGQMLREVVRVHRLHEGAAADRRVRELLDLVNLPASAADSYPRTLSGGQRQRVSIARALATEPRLIVADEPVSALDVSVQAAIVNLFADLRAELSLALVMISHNLAVVRQVSDRIAVMHDGVIVESGDTAEVLTNPSHAYTRRLLASVPSLAGPTNGAGPAGGKVST